MKKILFISPWSFDWNLEEIKRSPENAYFLRNLIKKFEIYHVVLDEGKVGTPLSSNHHIFPVKKINFREPYFFLINYLLNNLKLFLKSKEIIEKYQVNLVICGSSRTNLAGYFIKRFLNKRVILKLYGIYTYFNVNFFGKILLLPERISFHLPFDYIFVVDDGSGAERLRKITGFPKSKFKLLKNAYPVEWRERFKNYKEREEKIVLGVSALEKCKGFEYFIKGAREIIKKFNDVLFIICGEGSEEKKLKDLIQRYGIKEKVKLAGGIPHPFMPEFYLKSKVFVSTNLYGNKTIPVVEAMLFGLPVVAFKIFDEEKIIKDGKNGFVVEVKDYISLAEKVLLLLKDDDLRKRLGNFARKWIIENYPSWEKRIEEEIEIIEKFL